MSSIPLSRAVTAAPAPVTSPVADFQSHLSALYAQSQQNNYLFGSPLGPFFHQGRHAHLPRFVFFGPYASDDSWRLAFLAGYDQRDLRASRALLLLAGRLAGNAEEGHGLNLSFFPLVDAAGFYLGADPRALGDEHWGRSAAPEINLLEKDARLRGYHGFIRVESSTAEDEVIVIEVRHPRGTVSSPDLELISSEETEPYPVRFECRTAAAAVTAGPLSVSDDLLFHPFELVLRVPAAWPDELYHEAVGLILTRFIHRYRAFQAYGQHL
jgi:hypothetical protein